MNPIQELSERIAAFVAERDWDKFHSPKNLAIGLVLEAGEVLVKALELLLASGRSLVDLSSRLLKNSSFSGVVY